MPASVREAGIAVIGDRAFTPSQDGRLLHLRLTATSIETGGHAAVTDQMDLHGQHRTSAVAEAIALGRDESQEFQTCAVSRLQPAQKFADHTHPNEA